MKLKQDHGHKSMAYRRELETRRKELGFFNFVTKTIGYLGGKFVNPEFNDEELSGRDKVKGVVRVYHPIYFKFSVLEGTK